MDERTKQARGQPRVHDYDAGQNERQSKGSEGRVSILDEKPGDGSNVIEGRVRILDEKPGDDSNSGEDRVRILDDKSGDRSEPGHQGAKQVQERVGKAGNELTSFARAWTDMNSMAFGAFLSWQRGAAEFCGMRLSKHLDYSRRLVGAGDPATMLRLHSEYVREAVADFTSTVRELTTRSVTEAEQKGFAVIDRAAKSADHLKVGAETAVGRN